MIKAILLKIINSENATFLFRFEKKFKCVLLLIRKYEYFQELKT